MSAGGVGGGDGVGKRGLKVGPALQTSAHAPYSDLPHASVSPALGRAWGRGLGPALSELAPPGRAPWPRRTHAPARAHTSDIPIVPHVTLGPNVPTQPTRSRTRAHTRAHCPWPLPNSALLTPVLRPAKALIDGGTPTLIHRHTLPPTCQPQPQPHIHKQGREKYTRTPSLPTRLGALSHSCPLPGLPISLRAGTVGQAGVSFSGPHSPRPPGPVCCL